MEIRHNPVLFITQLLLVIRDFIIVIVGCLIVAAVYIFQGLHWLLKYLSRQKLIVFALLLLLSFGVFSLVAILLSTHNFSANCR